MKELSIEEKARAYDEVREKIVIRFSSNVADEIFSEYEESKDERIKKYIIKYFEASKDELSEGFKWNGITVEECIAWLEKQGEQKPADKAEPKKEDTSELTPFEAELFSMMSDAWQGYQLGEEVNIAEIVKEHSSELLERANKQKPAWSEDDEAIYYGVIETEQYMLDVVNGIKEFDVGNISIRKECTRELNWLKSLKNRYTWKPSDEQMNALNYVVNLMASSEKPTENDLYYNILKSLRQQLMKLKG